MKEERHLNPEKEKIKTHTDFIYRYIWKQFNNYSSIQVFFKCPLIYFLKFWGIFFCNQLVADPIGISILAG